MHHTHNNEYIVVVFRETYEEVTVDRAYFKTFFLGGTMTISYKAKYLPFIFSNYKTHILPPHNPFPTIISIINKKKERIR